MDSTSFNNIYDNNFNENTNNIFSSFPSTSSSDCNNTLEAANKMFSSLPSDSILHRYYEVGAETLHVDSAPVKALTSCMSDLSDEESSVIRTADVKIALKGPTKCVSPCHNLKSCSVYKTGMIVNGIRVLGFEDDSEWLSDMDCFVRCNIEVFSACEDDVEAADLDGRDVAFCGQVGMRCIHCAVTAGAEGAAIFYPPTIDSIYECVRDFERNHLANCENMPTQDVKAYKNLSSCGSETSFAQRYYSLSAKAAGLKDSLEGVKFESLSGDACSTKRSLGSITSSSEKRRRV